MLTTKSYFLDEFTMSDADVEQSIVMSECRGSGVYSRKLLILVSTIKRAALIWQHRGLEIVKKSTRNKTICPGTPGE